MQCGISTFRQCCLRGTMSTEQEAAMPCRRLSSMPVQRGCTAAITPSISVASLPPSHSRTQNLKTRRLQLQPTRYTRAPSTPYVHLRHTEGCASGETACSVQSHAPMGGKLSPRQRHKAWASVTPPHECHHVSGCVELSHDHSRSIARGPAGHRHRHAAGSAPAAAPSAAPAWIRFRIVCHSRSIATTFSAPRGTITSACTFVGAM